MGLFWTTGNNYGREAAAFLNIKMSLYLTGTTTTAMKRPYWAFAENNYGREAPAFLLVDKRKQLLPRSGRLLEFKQH